ncbi:DUF3667 domain-containing protein [Sphingomonas cavernae]|uniref:DUF3667 domain-containing protein n=1 Tax=Sphingomonas cavernae TaxID=2320861 RepID=A0A418WKD9_9SPHN|nr:DUF3667 domain-containing protein [Sphingomonas cavernae]RJF90488.1 DUF3667 domain-containing protein [Sphingomonas cavernae]
MTGEIEAAGDAITGGLVAKAIEGNAGEHGEHGDFCLNCGTKLVGSHCHACGQSGHIHRSLSAIWHDIAHGVLHFEGKIWRTLPLLALRPGELTRRYIHGERARFVSPLALFLFSVFLMFAVLSIFGSHLEAPADVQKDVTGRGAVEVKLKRDEIAAELAEIDRRIADARAAGRDTGDLEREKATVSGVVRIVEGGPTVLADKSGQLIGNARTGWTRLDKGIAKAGENPNLLLYKLQTNAYKFSWMLIPISVPFVWLLFFWHRKRHMYDHAVFVTYSLAFMTLFFTALTLLGALGVSTNWLAVAAVFLPAAHMFVQLKGAYEQSTAKALVRTFLLLNFTIFTIVIFLLLLLGLGLVG